MGGVRFCLIGAFQQAASRASGDGVRVNALCPGFVQTALISGGPSKLGRFSHLADGAFQTMGKIGILT